jgi:hypothetical protein
MLEPGYPARMPLRPSEPRTVTREFGPVRLWRDDLAEIVAVMRQVSPELTLETDAYTLDDVDELIDVKEMQVSAFRATSSDGRVRLILGRKDASISADDPDLLTRGMLGEIQRLADRRSRQRLRHKVFWWSFALSGFAAFVWSCSLGGGRATSSLVVYLAVLGGGLGIWIHFLDSPRQRAIIKTRTRAEAPPWLIRNRDALVTNAVVSAVFLVIGIVIGLMLPN